MEVLQQMHKSHDFRFMDEISEDRIPKIGFITYSNTEYQYIAAGFLRIVEGGYAQIDTMVTNPSLEPYVRNEGLTLLIETLIQTAKDMKLKGIYALTVDKSVLLRAEETGFQVIDHKIVALRL